MLLWLCACLIIIRTVTYHKIISDYITLSHLFSSHLISSYCFLFLLSIIATANDKNTSTLVVSSQLSDAYNAPTGELESFLHGNSLHRCNKKMKKVSTVNLNKTNQTMKDVSSTDEDSTRCLSQLNTHICIILFPCYCLIIDIFIYHLRCVFIFPIYFILFTILSLAIQYYYFAVHFHYKYFTILSHLLSSPLLFSSLLFLSVTEHFFDIFL